MKWICAIPTPLQELATSHHIDLFWIGAWDDSQWQGKNQDAIEKKHHLRCSWSQQGRGAKTIKTCTGYIMIAWHALAKGEQIILNYIFNYIVIILQQLHMVNSQNESFSLRPVHTPATCKGLLPQLLPYWPTHINYFERGSPLEPSHY